GQSRTLRTAPQCLVLWQTEANPSRHSPNANYAMGSMMRPQDACGRTTSLIAEERPLAFAAVLELRGGGVDTQIRVERCPEPLTQLVGFLQDLMARLRQQHVCADLQPQRELLDRLRRNDAVHAGREQQERNLHAQRIVRAGEARDRPQ